MKLILIIKEDITLFPPVQTIIKTLLDLGNEVVVIGHYSDDVQKQNLVSRGVRFHDPGYYDLQGSQFAKLRLNIRFRSNVKNILKSLDLREGKYCLWIFQALTFALLHKVIKNHPSILHPLEFAGKKIKRSYQILSPGYNAVKTFRSAKAIVTCEYNRAQITKGLFGLDYLPFVLPNKMMIDEEKLANPPSDFQELIEEIKEKVRGKKVVLYQGIFVKGERRLDEFCNAVSTLGEDYVFIIMGPNYQEGYRQLQNKFPDGRIIFVPFINPPYHLLVTSLAHIGVLTYFPVSKSMASVINPLYCAPNKIFEYGKFGIPMIGNDIPGLTYIFREHKCGQAIGYPMTEEKIEKAISAIMSDYDTYSEGSKSYYNSVDVAGIIKEIVEWVSVRKY